MIESMKEIILLKSGEAIESPWVDFQREIRATIQLVQEPFGPSPSFRIHVPGLNVSLFLSFLLGKGPDMQLCQAQEDVDRNLRFKENEVDGRGDRVLSLIVSNVQRVPQGPRAVGGQSFLFFSS